MRGKAGIQWLLGFSTGVWIPLIQTSLYLGMELREAWMWPGMRWRNWTCYPILWWSTCSSPPTAPASWFRRRIKTRLSPPRRRGWEHGRNAVPLLTSRWHYRVGKNLVALLFFSFWDFPWFLKFCFLKKKNGLHTSLARRLTLSSEKNSMTEWFIQEVKQSN